MTCDHKWTVDAELGDHKSSIIRCVKCQTTYIGSDPQERRKDPILTGDVGYIHRRTHEPADAARIHQRKAPIPIDDAMVERVAKAMYEAAGPCKWDVSVQAYRDIITGEWFARARAGLAALNPKPPEPEIPVTQEMIEAGKQEELRQMQLPPGFAQTRITAMYRAMAKVAPK